jgi:hypothetical protein
MISGLIEKIFGKKYRIPYHVRIMKSSESGYLGKTIIVTRLFRCRDQERARAEIKRYWKWLVENFEVSHCDVMILPKDMKSHGL